MSDTVEQLQNIISIMAKLRDPDTGCPWDVKQDFASIAPYTIEEAYEVADAVQSNDRAALCSELGDLLLQVVFHARIAEEEGSFTLADVAKSISDKMISRHPHVFGDDKTPDANLQHNGKTSKKPNAPPKAKMAFWPIFQLACRRCNGL